MNLKIPVWIAVLLILAASASTATAGRLITGKQIKDRSITLRDLSPATRAALRGQVGPPGPEGKPGPADSTTERTHVTPAAGTSHLTGPFAVNPTGPNIGQLTIAPSASSSPEGVAQVSLVPNDPDPGNGQSRTAVVAFHPERSHIEDATIKAHRHPGDGAPGHWQVHTKNAAGTNLIDRFGITYGVDQAQVLVTSADLALDDNANLKPRHAGQSIRFKNGAGDRVNLAVEDSGVLAIDGEPGVFTPSSEPGILGYLTVRVAGHLGRMVIRSP